MLGVMKFCKIFKMKFFIISILILITQLTSILTNNFLSVKKIK
jgi:hypothetical protein